MFAEYEIVLYSLIKIFHIHCIFVGKVIFEGRDIFSTVRKLLSHMSRVQYYVFSVHYEKFFGGLSALILLYSHHYK